MLSPFAISISKNHLRVAGSLEIDWGLIEPPLYFIISVWDFDHMSGYGGTSMTVSIQCDFDGDDHGDDDDINIVLMRIIIS